MRMQPFLVILVGLLLLVGGFVLWQQMSAQFDSLHQTIGQLEERAEKAEKKAAEAEARATEASTSAVEAAARAVEAIEREEVSRQEAQTAVEREQVALENERLAQADRLEAQRVAQTESEARVAAEKKRADTEWELDSARVELETAREETVRARQETEQAKAEVEKVKAKMERELDRMERSLSRIASTRRTALGLVMTLDSGTIEFDFNQATLRPKNREVLSRIAGVLLTFDNYGIQIFGHTDDVGAEDYNLQLSKRRAETVERYLAEAGVSRKVMSTMGMGEGDPLVAGSDEASRQRNRRVELAIVFSEGEYEAIESLDPAEGASAGTPGR